MLHTHSQLWGANGCMEMSKNEIAISVNWNVCDRRPSCEGLITKIWTTQIFFQQIYTPCLFNDISAHLPAMDTYVTRDL